MILMVPFGVHQIQCVVVVGNFIGDRSVPVRCSKALVCILRWDWMLSNKECRHHKVLQVGIAVYIRRLENRQLDIIRTVRHTTIHS